MTDTANLALPLVQPAQAQKHVTVNEALTRVDALAQLTLLSVSETQPPQPPVEGTAFGVPPGAADAWAGQEGKVALAIGGGWVFVPARRGWRAMVIDAGQPALFDGTDWRIGAATLTGGGASLNMRSVERDVSLPAGASVITPLVFPARTISLGVTGRVLSAITGSASGWDIGVAGDEARHGSGLGSGEGTVIHGPGAPVVVWEETPVLVTATGGAFSGGTLRLAAHFLELVPPAAV